MGGGAPDEKMHRFGAPNLCRAHGPVGISSAGLECGEDPLGGLARPRVKGGNAAATADQPGAPIPEHLCRVAAPQSAAKRRPEPLERRVLATEDDHPGPQGSQRAREALLGKIRGQEQHSEAGPAQEQLQRLNVDRLDAERRSGGAPRAAGSPERRDGAPSEASRWPSGMRARARPRDWACEPPSRALAGAAPRRSAPASGSPGSPRARDPRRPRRSGRRPAAGGPGSRAPGRDGEPPRPRRRCSPSRAGPRAAPRARRGRTRGGSRGCDAGGDSPAAAPSFGACSG